MNATAGQHHAGFSAVVPLPFGPMGIACSAEEVTELVFLPPATDAMSPTSALAAQTARALQDWLDDPERPCLLPLARRGTNFQRRVWNLISAIPRGRTQTYGELARSLTSSPRAVGGACGANPFPLLVPCHRVVAANGPGGFANDRGGHLIRVKQWLLAHEATR